MRSFRWALIQCDKCLEKKRKFGHTHTKREDKAQGEDGPARARETPGADPSRMARRGNQYCDTLILRLPASRL